MTDKKKPSRVIRTTADPTGTVNDILKTHAAPGSTVRVETPDGRKRKPGKDWRAYV